MDTQTIYKSGGQYYEIHSKELLDKGYVILEDTDEYTVFGESHRDEPVEGTA